MDSVIENLRSWVISEVRGSQFPDGIAIHEEQRGNSLLSQSQENNDTGGRLANCIFEGGSGRNLPFGVNSPLREVVDGLTDCFVKQSVKQMQDLERQMTEMDAHREYWEEEDEDRFDEIKERYLTVYKDYIEVTGIESKAEEAGSPFVWNPVNLSGLTDYPELNEAAEALINRQIGQARMSGVLNVELPLFEDILKAISKHPIWTIFLDEDDEFDIAQKILKYVTSIWRERRLEDLFTNWTFGTMTDPAINDPELERKLQRNAEIGAAENEDDRPSSSTKRIRLSD